MIEEKATVFLLFYVTAMEGACMKDKYDGDVGYSSTLNWSVLEGYSGLVRRFLFLSIWLFFSFDATRRCPTSKHRMRKSYLEMMS